MADDSTAKADSSDESKTYELYQDTQTGKLTTNYGRDAGGKAETVDPFPGVRIDGIATTLTPEAQKIAEGVGVYQRLNAAQRAEVDARLANNQAFKNSIQYGDQDTSGTILGNEARAYAAERGINTQAPAPSAQVRVGTSTVSQVRDESGLRLAPNVKYETDYNGQRVILKGQADGSISGQYRNPNVVYTRVPRMGVPVYGYTYEGVEPNLVADLKTGFKRPVASALLPYSSLSFGTEGVPGFYTVEEFPKPFKQVAVVTRQDLNPYNLNTPKDGYAPDSERATRSREANALANAQALDRLGLPPIKVGDSDSNAVMGAIGAAVLSMGESSVAMISDVARPSLNRVSRGAQMVAEGDPTGLQYLFAGPGNVVIERPLETTIAVGFGAASTVLAPSAVIIGAGALSGLMAPEGSSRAEAFFTGATFAAVPELAGKAVKVIGNEPALVTSKTTSNLRLQPKLNPDFPGERVGVLESQTVARGAFGVAKVGEGSFDIQTAPNPLNTLSGETIFTLRGGTKVTNAGARDGLYVPSESTGVIFGDQRFTMDTTSYPRGATVRTTQAGFGVDLEGVTGKIEARALGSGALRVKRFLPEDYTTNPFYTNEVGQVRSNQPPVIKSYLEPFLEVDGKTSYRIPLKFGGATENVGTILESANRVLEPKGFKLYESGGPNALRVKIEKSGFVEGDEGVLGRTYLNDNDLGYGITLSNGILPPEEIGITLAHEVGHAYGVKHTSGDPLSVLLDRNLMRPAKGEGDSGTNLKPFQIKILEENLQPFKKTTAEVRVGLRRATTVKATKEISFRGQSRGFVSQPSGETQPFLPDDGLNFGDYFDQLKPVEPTRNVRLPKSSSMKPLGGSDGTATTTSEGMVQVAKTKTQSPSQPKPGGFPSPSKVITENEAFLAQQATAGKIASVARQAPKPVSSRSSKSKTSFVYDQAFDASFGFDTTNRKDTGTLSRQSTSQAKSQSRASSSSSSFDYQQDALTRQVVNPRFFVTPKQDTRQVQRQRQAVAVRTATQSRQTQKQIVTPFAPGYPKITETTGGLPVILPKYVSGATKTKNLRQFVNPKYSYNPSVAASEFKLTSKTKPNLVSGFEIRPLLNVKRPKR